MLELDKRIHLIARLPPPKELAAAWNAFIASRQARNTSIEDFHAVQVLQTLQSVEERNEQGQPPWLSHTDLNRALVLVANGRAKLTEIHNKLARVIYQGLQDRLSRSDATDAEMGKKRLTRYAAILCQTGDSLEARGLLQEFWSRHGPEKDPRAGPWSHIIRGFAREDNEKELLRTVEIMEQLSIPLGSSTHEALTSHYAKKDNIEQTKRWFTKSMLNVPKTKHLLWSDESIYRILLEFCLRNDEMEWGRTVLNPGSPRDSQAYLWDAIFRAAAATGRSVDGIDQMISVMVRRGQEDGNEDSRPDILTFNGLIQFSISRDDPYMAERYFALAEKWNVTPNAQTYILQIEYRLRAGDVDGAKAAYAKLRNEKIQDNEDWAIMNKMLQVLSTATTVDRDFIMGVVEDISDRNTVFDADTVLALCTYHLKRDEYFEVVDLLQTYAYQFSTSQRLQIRDLLASFTLDPANDTGRAWDTYMILHQVFDVETRSELRTQIMSTFFDRRRPDLATHVFTRMSRHVRADSRPNVNTYIAALEGIAANQEPEALEVVHNLLKLDTETEPCTKLYNALMLAYTSVDIPWRSLEFWEDIATSEEGPTYESLHIALRACEKAAFGYRKAKQIWEKVKQADIAISRELFASYVGALAGNQLFDDVVELIEKMEDVVGEGPDEFT